MAAGLCLMQNSRRVSDNMGGPSFLAWGKDDGDPDVSKEREGEPATEGGDKTGKRKRDPFDQPNSPSKAIVIDTDSDEESNEEPSV